MSQEKIRRVVREAVVVTGRVKALSEGDDHVDLVTFGIDSMAALGIINDVEDRLGVVVDDRAALRLRTIEAIVAYLEALAGRADPAPMLPAQAAVRPVEISLATHPFLASHRILGHLLFPFAMALELFVSEWRSRTSGESVQIEDLVVGHPLVIPPDGARTVQLCLRPVGNATFEADLRQDGSRPFYSCRLSVAPLPGGVEPPPWREQGRWLGEELYEGLLPHGEHFHCRFGFHHFGPGGVRSLLSEQDRARAMLASVPSSGLSTRPCLIDGVLQLCGLHALRYSRSFVLPEKAALLKLHLPSLAAPEELLVDIKEAGPLNYDVVGAAAGGRPALEIVGLQFSAASVEASQADAARARLEKLLLEQWLCQ